MNTVASEVFILTFSSALKTLSFTPCQIGLLFVQLLPPSSASPRLLLYWVSSFESCTGTPKAFKEALIACSPLLNLLSWYILAPIASSLRLSSFSGSLGSVKIPSTKVIDYLTKFSRPHVVA